MNPWHDIYIDDAHVDESFPTVIEVPYGSRNKYEIDKESGLLKLDRVLYGAVHYPANYGFIPRTYCDDGDALDVLVLGQEPVHPLTIVESRAVAVLRMRDDKGVDDKIIAVAVNDPAVSDIRSYDELPEYKAREISRFFHDYKALEQKEVLVDDIRGIGDALSVIHSALDMYRKLRRGELART